MGAAIDQATGAIVSTRSETVGSWAPVTALQSTGRIR
jgi:hypothetical protein